MGASGRIYFQFRTRPQHRRTSDARSARRRHARPLARSSQYPRWRFLDPHFTWITAALRPTGPYPILVLRGASGAGKSTTARMLRALLDPARTPLETLPTTPHRMEQASAHQRILAIDDLDRLPRAVLSALAKAADETNPVILVLSSNFTRELPETIARRALIVDSNSPRHSHAIRSPASLRGPAAASPRSPLQRSQPGTRQI